MRAVLLQLCKRHKGAWVAMCDPATLGAALGLVLRAAMVIADEFNTQKNADDVSKDLSLRITGLELAIRKWGEDRIRAHMIPADVAIPLAAVVAARPLPCVPLHGVTHDKVPGAGCGSGETSGRGNAGCEKGLSAVANAESKFRNAPSLAYQV